MARNAGQSQKGLSEPAFDRQYGTKEQCRAVVMAARWPDRFWCPACGGREHSMVTTRDLFQCTACRRQTSPIAGTIFASTKLPLRTWFRAIYHLTQEQSFAFSDQAGHLQQRLPRGRAPGRQAHRNAQRLRLGRGAPGKTPFIAAVETTPEGEPVRLKLSHVTSLCGTSPSSFAKRNLGSSRKRCAFRRACMVVSDGLQCFGSVIDAGCDHQVIKTGSGPTAARVLAFKWINTALGNIKAAITGTYRTIGAKRVPRYLAEFEYRFNRRYDLAAMIPRLC